MQLNRAGDGVYFLDAGINLGLVTLPEGELPSDPSGRPALLIDAGLDESVAKRVLRLLGEHGLVLTAVLVTHAHADHSGGAAYLAKTTGAQILASAFDKTGLEHPIWEPVYLFGGAFPPAPLLGKFTNAPPVIVDAVVEPGPLQPPGCPFKVEVVPLPGHSLGQIGVAAFGILFSADAVVGPEVIAKHGVPLNADVGRALKTYDLLEQRAAAGQEQFFVPAHGRPGPDIRSLTAANRARLAEASGCIIQRVAEGPCSVEDLIAAVAARFGPAISGLGQYYLCHLTVLAYVGYLLDQGLLASRYEDGRQLLTPGPREADRG